MVEARGVEAKSESSLTRTEPMPVSVALGFQGPRQRSPETDSMSLAAKGQ
jgi:hypothetical protein